MSHYFPEPHGNFGGNGKAALDLSEYTEKADMKVATSTNTSTLAWKNIYQPRRLKQVT